MNTGQAAAKALVALLGTKSLTTVSNFYAEHEDPNNAEDTANNDRDLPCVLCYFTDAQENPPGFGNFDGVLHCRIEVGADDVTQDQFEAIFSEVWQAIYSPTFLTELNAATDDFTAFGYTGAVTQTNQQADGLPARRVKWKEMNFPINCTPFTVS